jgi:aryl-alcohol dehydrogenase-like predicted oxidoreductase
MSKLGLGTVQFGLDYGISSSRGSVNSNEVKKILNYAQSKNLSFLDTSPSYGDAEKVLGLNDISSFEVITKTRYFDAPKIGKHDSIILNNDLDISLHNLKQKSVYGLLIHNADDLLKSGAENLYRKLIELKVNGKIKKLGVSIYDYNQLISITNFFDIDLVQLPLNIIDRRLADSGLLKKLRDNDIEIHARSIFLQGLLLMQEKDRPKKFNKWKNLWNLWHEWLNDNQISALDATIRYAISLEDISRVIVGVDNAEQLKEIVTASNGDLPQIPHELIIDDPQLLNPTSWKNL